MDEGPAASAPSGTGLTGAEAPGPDLVPPEVLRAAIGGDERAVALLLSRVHPQVQRFCRARLGRRESTLGSADDVAQDVCAAVLTALPGYTLPDDRPSGMSFRAFVFGIARHKVADAFRVVARNRCDAVAELPEIAGPDDDPEQVALDAERDEHLAELLGVLGARQVETLVLRIAVGLSAEEAADVLGSTPGAVRVAQHRALQRLRRELETRAARRTAAPPPGAPPAPRIPAPRPPYPAPRPVLSATG